MAAYDMLMNLVKEYFVELGYNPNFIEEYLSPKNFREIASIRLANANVMIKNKTDHSSHQTHIAITGEMIDFFCPWNVFREMDNVQIKYWPIVVDSENLSALLGSRNSVTNTTALQLIDGTVSWGKRTQKQIQLSKRNTLNSDCFNQLRLGLFENDLLIMLKYRDDSKILAVGIPQIFYLDYIPDYSEKYETNTYLRIPYVTQEKR